MSKIIGYFSALLFIISIIVWTFVFVLGGVEILWWIFTGGCFHFVNGVAAAF